MTSCKNVSELPAMCWIGPTEAAKMHVSTGHRIDRGDAGYLPLSWLTDDLANQLNKNIGATAQIVLAMQIGSMFGWHVPGANPENLTAKES
jgi:hypothetical protein